MSYGDNQQDRPSVSRNIPPQTPFDTSGRGGGHGLPPRGGSGGGGGMGNTIMAVMLVIVVIACGYLYYQNNSTNTRIDALTQQMADYPTKVTAAVDSVNTAIAGIPNSIVTQVNSAISSHTTRIQELENKQSSYATVSQLSDYATTSQLSSYATVSQLSGYATTSQLGHYVNIDQLSGYVTTSQLSGYVTQAQYDLIKAHSDSQDVIISQQSSEITALWDVVNDNDLLHNKISIMGISNISSVTRNGTATNTHSSAYAWMTFRLKIKNNGSQDLMLNKLVVNLDPNFDYSSGYINFHIDEARLYRGAHLDEKVKDSYHYGDPFNHYELTNINLAIDAGDTEYVILTFAVYYNSSLGDSDQAEVVSSMEITPTATLVSYEIED